MNYTLNFSGASVFSVNHTTSTDSLLLTSRRSQIPHGCSSFHHLVVALDILVQEDLVVSGKLSHYGLSVGGNFAVIKAFACRFTSGISLSRL